eukprot:7380610-Pyramimonas_sp.AAC.1
MVPLPGRPVRRDLHDPFPEPKVLLEAIKPDEDTARQTLASIIAEAVGVVKLLFAPIRVRRLELSRVEPHVHDFPHG